MTPDVITSVIVEYWGGFGSGDHVQYELHRDGRALREG